MEEKDRKPVGGCLALAIFALAVFVVIDLYILSVGPARWLEKNGYIGQGLFEAL